VIQELWFERLCNLRGLPLRYGGANFTGYVAVLWIARLDAALGLALFV